MASQTSTIDASVAVGGSVDRSAIVTGNNNDVVVVNNYHGVQMGKVGANERPEPKLRATPILLPTRRFKNPVGRKAELERVKAALAEKESLCWHGEDGMGKTVLLKILEHDIDLADYPHGLFHFLVENTAIDEVRASIFDAFFECEVAFKPNKSQFRQYMKDICAVLVLDDVNLTSKEVEALYDDVEQCVLLVASEKPIHFSDAEVEVLQGLPQDEAICYLEQQLKRSLDAKEKPLAAELCTLRQGHPMHLKLDANRIRNGEHTFEQIISSAKPSSEESTQKSSVDSNLDQPQLEAARLLAALQGALASPDLIASLTKNLGQQSSGSSGVQADQQDLLKKLSDIGLAHSGSGYRLRSDLQDEIQRTTDLTPYREQLLQYFLASANQYEDNQQRFLEDVGPLLGILRWAADEQRWSEVLELCMAIQGRLWDAKRWTTWGKVLELVLQASEALKDQYHVGWAKHQLGTLAAIRHDDLREPSQSMNAYRQFRLLNDARRIRESLGDPLALGITQNNLAIARKRWYRRIVFLCLILLLSLFIGTGGAAVTGLMNGPDEPPVHFEIDPISIRPGEQRQLKVRLTAAGLEHAKAHAKSEVVFAIELNQDSGLLAPTRISVPVEKASETFTLTAGSNAVSSRLCEMTVSCPDSQICRVPIKIEPNVPPETLVLQDLTLEPSSVVAGYPVTVKLLFNRSPRAEEQENLKLSCTLPSRIASYDCDSLDKAFSNWPQPSDWLPRTFTNDEGVSCVNLDTPSTLVDAVQIGVTATCFRGNTCTTTLTIEPPPPAPQIVLERITPHPNPVVAGNATTVKLRLNRAPLESQRKSMIRLSYEIQALSASQERTKQALKKAMDSWPTECDWNTFDVKDASISIILNAPKIDETCKVQIKAQYANVSTVDTTLVIEPLLTIVDVSFDPASVVGGDTTNVKLLLNRTPLAGETNQNVALSYTFENEQSTGNTAPEALEKMRDQWPKDCEWKTLTTDSSEGALLNFSLTTPNIYEAANLKVAAAYAQSPAADKTLAIKPANSRVTSVEVRSGVSDASEITGGHPMKVEIAYEGSIEDNHATVDYNLGFFFSSYFKSFKNEHAPKEGISLEKSRVGFAALTGVLMPALHDDVEFAITAKIETDKLQLVIGTAAVPMPEPGSQDSHTTKFMIRAPKPKALELNSVQAKQPIGGSTISATIRLDGPAPGAYGGNDSFDVEFYFEPVRKDPVPGPAGSGGALYNPIDNNRFVVFLDDSSSLEDKAESAPQPAKVLRFQADENVKTFDLPLPPVNAPTEYKIVAKRNGQSYVLKTITIFPPSLKAITVQPTNPVGGDIVAAKVVLDGNAGTNGIILDLDYNLPKELEEHNLGALREAKKHWPTLVEVAPGENTSKPFELSTMPFGEQVLVKVRIVASYSYPGCPNKPYSKKGQELTLKPSTNVRPANVECSAPQPCHRKIRVFDRRRR